MQRNRAALWWSTWGSGTGLATPQGSTTPSPTPHHQSCRQMGPHACLFLLLPAPPLPLFSPQFPVTALTPVQAISPLSAGLQPLPSSGFWPATSSVLKTSLSLPAGPFLLLPHPAFLSQPNLLTGGVCTLISHFLTSHLPQSGFGPSRPLRLASHSHL